MFNNKPKFVEKPRKEKSASPEAKTPYKEEKDPAKTMSNFKPRTESRVNSRAASRYSIEKDDDKEADLFADNDY